jgi:outer membrane protein
MNKKYLYIGFLLTTLLLTGCAVLDPQDEYYEFKVPDAKLHTITPIEPNEFKVKHKPAAPAAAEPNLPAAPAEMKMSLEECRALTLQNNLELQAQLIAPTIDATYVSEAQAKFESVFRTGTTFNTNDLPGGIDKRNNGSYEVTPGSQYNSLDSYAGVRMPLRTGGTLNFNLEDNRTNAESRLNSPAPPIYQNNLSFSFSQPLLKGAGKRVNMHSIRVAQYGKQITDNNTKFQVILILSNADKAYWKLYAARKELEVRQKQHELAVAQLERAKRQVAAGQLAKVEIIRAEAGVARQLAAIITAENNLRMSQRDFKKTINKRGLDIETPTNMIPATEADPIYYTFDTQKLVDQAYENRYELLDTELRIAESISTIDFQNNQMLPDVALNYIYNIPSTGLTRNDSYTMLNQKPYENHSIGITLEAPLGNEAAKSQLRRALYQKRQLLSTKSKQKQLVKQEVLDALDTAETNWQQIMASRQAALLEGQLYETEIRQFEVGLRTSTDVLDAQSKFADAQSSEITALVNYEISLIDMAYVTGTLLGADKILWEPITPIVPVD